MQNNISEKIKKAEQLVSEGMPKKQALVAVGIMPTDKNLRKIKVKRPTLRQKIIELYMQKVPAREISYKLQCSLLHVYSTLKKAGFKMQRHRKITDEVKQKVINLRKNGQTILKIYLETGLSEVSIRSIIEEEAKNMLKQGEAPEKVSAALRLSIDKVLNLQKVMQNEVQRVQ